MFQNQTLNRNQSNQKSTQQTEICVLGDKIKCFCTLSVEAGPVWMNAAEILAGVDEGLAAGCSSAALSLLSQAVRLQELTAH